MSEIRTEFVQGFGGVRLAVHRLGAGRPILLLHGLFSSAQVNWIKFGTAEMIAAAGREAIMLDFRAHGQSEAPHDPAVYPPDVLLHDVEHVVAALALSDFDLGGFSLGARTALKAVLAGLKPRKLVLGGMGYEGLVAWRGRTGHFLRVIERFGAIPKDDPAYFAQAFMKTQNVDLVAAKLLLESVSGEAVEELDAVDMPTLVVCGKDDDDNGSPTRLAEALPEGRYLEVPGTHMSSVAQPAFGRAYAEFFVDGAA